MGPHALQHLLPIRLSLTYSAYSLSRKQDVARSIGFLGADKRPLSSEGRSLRLIERVKYDGQKWFRKRHRTLYLGIWGMWMADLRVWVNLNHAALSFRLLRYRMEIARSREWSRVQKHRFETLHERLRLCCVGFDY